MANPSPSSIRHHPSGYLYSKGELVKKLKLDPEKIESSGYFFSTVAFSGKMEFSIHCI